MPPIGFDKPLYILPFDHRGSFQTQMFGWKGALSSDQTAKIASTKQIIYDGFKAAVAMGVPKEKVGILVGEEFEKHIEAFEPTFCKVLVRYNPEDDSASNIRQSSRLKRLSDYLRRESRSLFMFELL